MAEIAVLERTAVVRHGRRLEYFTIAWNGLEGLVSVVAGAIAGSISLVGFGIDSFIEVTSGSVLLWRMSVDEEVQHRELNERRALRIVGDCFLLLAAYIAYESVLDLWSRRAPEHSIPGIVLASVSLVGMPLFSDAKRKVGQPELRLRRSRIAVFKRGSTGPKRFCFPPARIGRMLRLLRFGMAQSFGL